VLLVAVGVDVWNKSQGRRSITGLFMRNRSTAAPTAASQPPVSRSTEKKVI
jgi:putative multiple sugar transport system permease protein